MAIAMTTKKSDAIKGSYLYKFTYYYGLSFPIPVTCLASWGILRPSVDAFAVDLILVGLILAHLLVSMLSGLMRGKDK